ncbi:hypothetical protein A2U01_0075510, partial [Trifolium medium]|nr:hypothetical protein [Trifolium medium]
VYVRIHAEADDKLSTVEELAATGECGIDPLIDHRARGGHSD